MLVFAGEMPYVCICQRKGMNENGRLEWEEETIHKLFFLFYYQHYAVLYILSVHC